MNRTLCAMALAGWLVGGAWAQGSETNPAVTEILSLISARRAAKQEAHRTSHKATVDPLTDTLIVLTKAPEAKPAPWTGEQQFADLENAMAEGLRTLDWKQVLIAKQGFASAGMSGDAWEIAVLRAERLAALDALRIPCSATANQIEMLGLAIRDGDAESLATLRTWAAREIPAITPSFMEFHRDHSQEAIQKLVVRKENGLLADRRDAAVLALALLDEPGIQERALALLKARKTIPASNTLFADMLVIAALHDKRDAGKAKVLELLADEKADPNTLTTILQTLLNIAQSKDEKHADLNFTLLGDGANLPRVTVKELARYYTAALARLQLTPDENGDPAVNYLIAAGMNFPKLSLDQDAIAELQRLRKKTSDHQWSAAQIDLILKQQGVDPSTPVKPPPPEDF